MCFICGLTGGRAASLLHRGNAEAESVFGTVGDDHLIGMQGDDTLRGGPGDDTIAGGLHNDALRGAGGDDVIRGGAGDDIVWGGRGDDRMFGGEGADRFVLSAGDWMGGPTRDVILDFEEDDLIDLRAVSDDELVFIGEDGFSGAAGEVRIRHTNAGNTVVIVDADGDGSADGRIVVKGSTQVSVDDFLL
ncbi:MAG: M10 family metallopeptidase C-terminal domain-containing protein [Pikeienuella sp.]|uniref:M10 family metallopeptidase C-terminal domain-containing protein n=1 Tax=Pikeienuella sp. TaxID=2831957 RepID=UPI00391C93F1